MTREIRGSPFPGDDPTLTALKLSLDDKRRIAQEKWEEFEEARQPAMEAMTTGKQPAKAVLAHIDEVHGRYEAAKEEAIEAEEAFMDHLDKAPGLGQGKRSGGVGAAFLKALGNDAQKALADTTGGAVVPGFWDPNVRDIPSRTTFVRNYIPVRRVTSGYIDYLQQTVQNQQAAPIPAGSEKPKSVYTVKRVEERVRVIAHVSEAVDRSLLQDNTSLEQFLDRQMRIGLLLSEENELLHGDGTGEHFTGILNTTGIGTTAGGGGTSAVDAIFAGITHVRLQYHEPDLIVVHPNDWQGIRTSKATSGEYLAGAILDADPNSLWGLPVVVTAAMTENTALVGAFAEGATIWDREDARISFAETGLGDAAGVELFTHNLLRFRAEERLAFGVEYPGAFCEVTTI